MELKIEDIHPFQQLIISLLLGLLVGLQRQWVEAPLAGIRTFSLISILGTVCALLASHYGDWIIAMGFLGTCAAMIVGHISKKSQTTSPAHSGLGTEFAMLIMYLSGVLVHVGPIWFAATVVGVLAVILQAKIELHGIVSRFSEKEIKAIMQFVLIALVIFPILPDQTYGPLAVLNPHEIWMMVVLIVAVSLAAYIIYKFFGEKAGALVGGILGGMLSSTATTVTYSKLSQEEVSAAPGNALIILIAWTVLYIRVFIEVILVAPQFHMIWRPLGIIFLVSLISILWLWKMNRGRRQGMPAQANPAELKIALTFGFLYSLIIFAVAFAKQYLGESGLTVVALLSGITDMDAITLSTARLVSSNKLAPSEGWPVIMTALLSNVFFKGLLTRFIGGKELFRNIFLPWLATLVSGLILLFTW